MFFIIIIIIVIIIIAIIFSWNYIVFCIKRALRVEKKKWNNYMQLSALETAQSSKINKKPQVYMLPQERWSTFIFAS